MNKRPLAAQKKKDKQVWEPLEMDLERQTSGGGEEDAGADNGLKFYLLRLCSPISHNCPLQLESS